MKKVTLAAATLMASSLIVFGAQNQKAPEPAAPAAEGSQSPVAKQPVPKSQEEVQALQAIAQAPDADSRVAAVENLVTKFADTEFKAWALMAAAATMKDSNKHDKAIIYAERALEADPQSYMAMIILSTELAENTREHDLDRDEKLARAEKYASKAIEIVKAAPRPQPAITDEQWAAGKADLIAQAHGALGVARMVKKDCDGGLPELAAAVSVPDPDPRTQLRLGMAETECGKPDEAIAIYDKLIASDLPPVFKQFAEREKQKAIQKKGGAAAPAPAASAAPAAQPQQ